jgi:ribosome-binding factor A
MSVSSIKKSQKESLLFRAIAQLFSQTTLDDKRLQGVAVNRVKLSDDKSHATVYFYTPGGPAEFKEKLPFILLYKASLRRALAQSINARYTPELVFKYDDQFEKQQRIEGILEKIKGEDSSDSSD